MNYFAAFTLSFLIAILLVPLVRRLAFQIGAVDHPDTTLGSRKIHKRAIARAGGLAIYVSFVATCLIVLPSFSRQFWGLLFAGTVVLLIGLVDDIHRQNAWTKLIFQVGAAVVAIMTGIKILTISNFSGGHVALNTMNHFLTIGPFTITIGLVASGLSLLWLVGMTNTINFLDGLDGLATGVAGIAGVIMFILSISSRVNQPITAILSITLAGACFGFLYHHFHPATIFIGDSGAYFLGMTLGILAIISGAKLATALLVLGLPILDAVWAVIRRVLTGRSPFSADRGHIHFMLLDSGLSQRQVVLTIYAFSIAFGTVALLSNTRQKVIALAILVGLTAILLTVLHGRHARGVAPLPLGRQSD